jgi:hypothetical protein
MQRRKSEDPFKLIFRGVKVDDVTKTSYSDSFWRGERSATLRRNTQSTWFIKRNDLTLDQALDQERYIEDDLVSIAMTLTGGENWYGLPVENPSAHLADYARCLLKEGLLWSLKRNLVNKAGRAMTNKRNADEAGVPGYVDIHVLQELAEGGNADRFLDAAATACA